MARKEHFVSYSSNVCELTIQEGRQVTQQMEAKLIIWQCCLSLKQVAHVQRQAVKTHIM